MTSPLLSLADRLEAATGPDRELFEDVFRECFPKPDNVWAGPVSRVEWTAEYSEWHARQCAFYDFLEAGAFLDAAMSLYLRVPERVPSNPRLAAAEALRQRAEVENV